MFQSSVYLPLRGVAAEVGHQAHAKGVGTLPTFHHAQVARRLRQALPEAQAAIILSQRMSLKVSWERQKRQEVGGRPVRSKRCTISLARKEETSVTFATSGMEHLQMVHSHLQYFSFFQFGRSLGGEQQNQSRIKC